MLKLDTTSTLAAFSYLGGMIKYLQYGRTELQRNDHPKSKLLRIDRTAYAHSLRSVQALSTTAKDMEMVVAKAAASRAEETLTHCFRNDEGYDRDTLSVLIDAMNQLLTSFKDEIEPRLIVSLSQRSAEQYVQSEPLFGKEVDLTFPRAAEDISEAGKCLAVGQPTAAVFHLMRSMECAVQVLSEKLEIPNIEREWGKLLSDIDKKIATMPKGSLRDQWSEVHANLYHVKQAWRNSTMHPKQTYTANEADAILVAVRSFMTDLARLVCDY